MVTPDKEKPAGCGFVMRRMVISNLYLRKPEAFHIFGSDAW